MASLPYPRCPPNSFHRTHSKFVYASPPTDFTEYTEASGGEESPTDFTDVHRFFFSASRFCVFREFCGKIVLWLRGYGWGCHTLLICVYPCNLWENILRQKLLCNLWEDIPHLSFLCSAFCGKIFGWLRGYGRDAIPS